MNLENTPFLPKENLADLDRKILLATSFTVNKWISVSEYMNFLGIPHTQYEFLKEVLIGLAREKWLRMVPDPQPPLPALEAPKFTAGSRLLYALKNEYWKKDDDLHKQGN